MIKKFPFGITLKTFLDSSKTYRRWKYSEQGLWLWRQFAKKQSAIIQNEDCLYRQLLNPLRTNKAPIFDIGANTGWLSKVFLNFSVRVVAVEPGVLNQEILKNRFRGKRSMCLVPKAVSSEENFRDIFIYESDTALNTFSAKWRKELEDGYLSERRIFTSQTLAVETTTLDALIAEHGLPSLVKIDVEGHELEVIKGLSQSVPLLIFEANLPVFKEETREIFRLLTNLDSGAKFNFSQNYQVVLPDFSCPDDILKQIEGIGKNSIDILCKMSNYGDFYKVN